MPGLFQENVIEAAEALLTPYITEPISRAPIADSNEFLIKLETLAQQTTTDPEVAKFYTLFVIGRYYANRDQVTDNVQMFNYLISTYRNRYSNICNRVDTILEGYADRFDTNDEGYHL
jgi:hypothetical protein